MGTIVRLSDHARASTGSGLATDAGHGASSGHCSENQRMTSSYLRAVKVFPSSSKRSKNLQSPAAKRPKVDKLTEREAAYADAHAMRFERSSVSMDGDDSRKIPTLQELLVGNFRLEPVVDTSDKSAMPSIEQIRHKIQRAMAGAGEGPVAVAVELGLERNHLRDFLTGKKRSLKTETMLAISERYGIPFKDLIVTKEKNQRRAVA
jgi:hypothetical protein